MNSTETMSLSVTKNIFDDLRTADGISYIRKNVTFEVIDFR